MNKPAYFRLTVEQLLSDYLRENQTLLKVCTDQQCLVCHMVTVSKDQPSVFRDIAISMETK